MFCTAWFSTLAAATSSSTISSSESRQPNAPRFSLACARVFTPTIGTVPLQMHQFRATCDIVFLRVVPISLRVASSGPAVGKTLRNIIPRGPDGIFPMLYLPVRRPKPSGEYAMFVTPRELAVSRSPLSRGYRDISENWTCLCRVSHVACQKRATGRRGVGQRINAI